MKLHSKVAISGLCTIALLSSCTDQQDNPLASPPVSRSGLFTATTGPLSLLSGYNGSTYIITRGINDEGVIAGVGGSSRTTRWDTGTGAMAASTAPVFVGWGEGFDVNAYGQIAGTSSAQAALWTPNGSGGYTLTSVGLPGAFIGTANAVNERGQVVGTSRLMTGSTWVDKCFLWTPDSDNGTTGVVEEIPGFGGNFCVANDINAAGQVVGMSNSMVSPVSHGFVRDGGATIALQPATDETYAIAINNGGQIAGFHTTSTASTAAIWNPSATGWGSANDIAVPALSGQSGFMTSVAMDINDAGFVVGYARDGTGLDRAFFWNAGEVLELPDPDPSTVMAGALTNAIDNQVIVAGSGIDNQTGVRRGMRWAVSLTPIVTEGCSERLARLIGELKTGGVINAGAYTSLMAKMDASARQAGAGKRVPARNVLYALIEEVDALESSRRLTPEQAAPLREAAQCIIAELA